MSSRSGKEQSQPAFVCAVLSGIVMTKLIADWQSDSELQNGRGVMRSGDLQADPLWLAFHDSAGIAFLLLHPPTLV
jgi:hypothetical protein